MGLDIGDRIGGGGRRVDGGGGGELNSGEEEPVVILGVLVRFVYRKIAVSA